MVKDQGHFNSNPYTQHCYILIHILTIYEVLGFKINMFSPDKGCIWNQNRSGRRNLYNSIHLPSVKEKYIYLT